MLTVHVFNLFIKCGICVALIGDIAVSQDVMRSLIENLIIILKCNLQVSFKNLIFIPNRYI